MMKFAWPVAPVFPIVQRFGENADKYPRTNGHMGIDFECPEGTPVLAAADGTVARVGNDPKGWGLYVWLIHPGGYATIYGHLARPLMTANQKVLAGARLGMSGHTGWTWRWDGSGVAYDHLHFEVRLNNRPVDPLPGMVGPVAEPVMEPVPEPVTEPVAIPTASEFPRLIRVLGEVRVRSEPSTEAMILGALVPGTRVQAEGVRTAGGDVWAQLGAGLWSAMLYAGEQYLEWV